MIRVYLRTKAGKLLHITTPWFKVDAEGWFTFKKGRNSYGKYRLDTTAFTIEPYMKWNLMPGERFAIIYLEGRPDPISLEGGAASPNRSAELIEEAMDRTWIQQALRRPGWDTITLLLLLSVIANLVLGGGIVAAAMR